MAQVAQSDVVSAPCLDISKVRMDRATWSDLDLSNLLWLNMSLLIAGRLYQMIFKGPLQPNYSIILLNKIDNNWVYFILTNSST